MDRLRVLLDKEATLQCQIRSPESTHLFYTTSNDKNLLLATRNSFLIHGHMHPLLLPDPVHILPSDPEPVRTILVTKDPTLLGIEFMVVINK